MPNKLINEQSPYLLQHAHNPVNWYAWGDEAFEAARKENKPVLVSIGYAACHWCHVMEHESFENEEVAAYMNEHFINIKVDREEHPGVDHFYMDAAQAISGNGGWPLNVFATADRVPFYGGTYYPPRPIYNRPSWRQLLERIHQLWTEQPGEIEAQSNQMLQYLKQTAQVANTTAKNEWDNTAGNAVVETLLKQADTKWGGFGRAPKFPATMNISFLLEHYHYTGHEPSLKQALLSLDCMIKGGINDQLAGGFARYSTDDKWLAPHFEKMLYDNALLIMALCDAYNITRAPIYKTAIEETIAFVERDLKEPGGGYYSAIDADSEGVEGKYYTWTIEEWQDAVGDEPVVKAYFGVEDAGNWEETNILHIAKSIEEVAQEYGLKEEEITAKITTVKKQLLNQRLKRISPLTDDKSLLSWNALMNLAITKSATVLKRDDYKKRAVEHMHWMVKNFTHNEALMHTWKQGQARISANLDDYAYLIQALLQLASATGDDMNILHAFAYSKTVLQEFKDEGNDMFYYTSITQKDIPARKVDVYDGALPSANAVMAHNLLLLGLCMEETGWYEHGVGMLKQIQEMAGRYPSSFGYWCLLHQRYAKGLKLVMCTGADAKDVGDELRSNVLPHAYLITSQKEISKLNILKGKFFEGKTRIFVCTDTHCLPPLSLAEQALELI